MANTTRKSAKNALTPKKSSSHKMNCGKQLSENKLKTDEDLMDLKFRLIKRLLENKIDTETIYAILEFINIYLPFANLALEIESIIDKEKDIIRQLYDRKIREDGEKLYKKEVIA